MHTVRLSQAALPYLEASGRGSIVAISSVSGREADFAAGPYGTMKTAIVGYIKGLAFQLAGRGVRANVVSPGNTYFEGGVWQQIEQGIPGPVRLAMRAEPDRTDGHAGGDGPGRRLPVQPGVRLTTGTHLRRRRRADPRHPALTDVLEPPRAGPGHPGPAAAARPRAPMPVAEALEHLVGLQAQVPRVPHLALWDRLAGLRPGRAGRADDVARRRPDPAHADDDPHRHRGRRAGPAPAAAAGARPDVRRHRVGSAAARSGRRRGRGRGGRAARPNGRWAGPQLQRELAARHPGLDARGASTFGVSYWVPWVQPPPRGPVERLGRGGDDHGGGVAGRRARRGHLDDLVLRYLGAFGPASVRDIQAWCGLTRLREVVDRLGPRLRRFRTEDGVELFDVPDGAAARPGHPGARPLPRRVRQRRPVPRRPVPRRGRRRPRPADGRTGRLDGTVLVDGLLRATWAARRDGDATVLTVRPSAAAVRGRAEPRSWPRGSGCWASSRRTGSTTSASDARAGARPRRVQT